jgi:hypothetical protein
MLVVCVEAGMSRRVMTFVRSAALIASLTLPLAACASGPVASGDGKVTGNENGGKIVEALGPVQAQSMQLVSAYCAKHEKKGFVTRMDYDNNTITFECRRQTRTG